MTARVTQSEIPAHSLERGEWVKLICGASYQDLPAIRNLALVYSLAGVDCIDVAADPAVIATTWEGIEAAQAIADRKGLQTPRPWVMVSLNDGEDPHFRKATFDPQRCPPDCPRPCARVCPTAAISHAPQTGILAEKCYGCGRCLTVCPLDLIHAQATTLSFADSVQQLAPLIHQGKVQAIELHTQVGHRDAFHSLYTTLAPCFPSLELLAISCPWHPDSVPYLTEIAQTLTLTPQRLLWQADGRPMSGDLGKGTTHACIHYAQELSQQNLPGFIQLAGGTNAHTWDKCVSLSLRSPVSPALKPETLQGIAFGGAARKLLTPIFQTAEQRENAGNSPANLRPMTLESHPDLLQQAINLAEGLVHPWKQGTFAGAP